MTAIEAIIYCLGFVNDVAEDGEYHSQTAYDVNGDPHWIAWQANCPGAKIPKFCSESAFPFSEILEPYRT